MQTANTPVIHSASLPSLPRFVSSTLGLLVDWSERSRNRKSLGSLDPHLLRDIGLDPITARDEANRPFWQR